MEENNIIMKQPEPIKHFPNEAPQPQEKPKFDIEKGDMTFVIFALIFSVFASLFGIFSGFSLGYLLSTVFMVSTIIIYLAKKGRFRAFSIICGLLTLGNAAVFITTTNVSIKFFAVIISFLLSLVCFSGFTKEKVTGNRETIGIFYSAASTIGNIALSVKSVFTKRTDGKKSFGKVMLGLACSIPVLIIVMPLLLKSDAAFSGMMSNIFGRANNFTLTISKVIFGTNISLIVISYGFSLKSERFAKLKESKFTGIENVLIISFLSAIAVCYLLYLFSQLAYFFSAFNGFLPDNNITYAQYARRGFFEMCVIAVINLTLVLLGIFLSKKPNGKVCFGIKILTTFISVFTLIIIATAISKMVLYINNYGMTIRRVTTSAFMIFLAVVFIAVILRIYSRKINVVKTALLTAGVVVLLLGTVNVNKVCAQYNYKAYKSDKLQSIDVQAMYDLGDEGIPYVVRLACSKDRTVAGKAQSCLRKAYKYDYFDNCYDVKFTVEELKQRCKDNGFERYSIPKQEAYDYLYEFAEKNPSFHASMIESTIYEDSSYN